MRPCRANSILTVALIAMLLLSASGCAATETRTPHEPLTLAVVPWPGSAPVYVAAEKGFFAAEGLDVTLEEYVSGHIALADMLAGDADLATASDVPISKAALEDADFSVIATLSRISRSQELITRKSSGIVTMSDLAGRRVGVTKGTAADFYLHVSMVMSFMETGSIEQVDIEADKVADALLTAQVDAVSTWAPHTLALHESLGDDAMVVETADIYRMTWNLVSSRELVTERPETVVALLRALRNAEDFILDHPAEARSTVVRTTGTDAALLEEQWDRYQVKMTLDQGLVVSLEDQARWALESSGQMRTSPPEMMRFLYTDALQAVSPGAVRLVGE